MKAHRYHLRRSAGSSITITIIIIMIVTNKKYTYIYDYIKHRCMYYTETYMQVELDMLAGVDR